MTKIRKSKDILRFIRLYLKIITELMSNLIGLTFKSDNDETNEYHKSDAPY